VVAARQPLLACHRGIGGGTVTPNSSRAAAADGGAARPDRRSSQRTLSYSTPHRPACCPIRRPDPTDMAVGLRRATA